MDYSPRGFCGRGNDLPLGNPLAATPLLGRSWVSFSTVRGSIATRAQIFARF